MRPSEAYAKAAIDVCGRLRRHPGPKVSRQRSHVAAGDLGTTLDVVVSTSTVDGDGGGIIHESRRVDRQALDAYGNIVSICSVRVGHCALVQCSLPEPGADRKPTAQD